MKNTFIFFLIVLFEVIGVTMTLILLYASPTQEAQGFEASIVYLSTSILLASFFTHLSFAREKNNLLRNIYIVLALAISSYSITFVLIMKYAYPGTTLPPKGTVLLFLIAFIINVVGFIFMLMNNPKIIKESSHEK